MTIIITQDTIFTLQANETLLEALERTGHDVEYQCRSGYCGSCRLKLLNGLVTYPNPPLAFIGPYEILPCCCQVQTDLELECRLKVPDTAETDADLFDN